MKRRIIIAAVVVLLPLLAWAASGYVTSKQLNTTNSSTTVPTRLSSVRGAYATSITIIGNKASRTANTGTVYIGPTSTDNDQPIAIASGSLVTLTFTPDQYIDLYDWYLDVATANDGVVIIYSR